MHQTFTWGPLVEADCGYGEAGIYGCAEIFIFCYSEEKLGAIIIS